MVDEYTTVPLTQLAAACDQANSEGKYAFIDDQNGNCATFFNYRGGALVGVDKLAIKLATGMSTKDDVVEELRKPTVACTKSGNRLVLGIGQATVDFNGRFNKFNVFPTDKLFDREAWCEEANHMAIVTEEENVDLSGNKGQYVKSPDFQLVILSSKADAATLADQLANIPHIEKFKKIRIN